MSFSLNKLRSFLPSRTNSTTDGSQRHSVSLEPEVGFQLTLEPHAISGGSSGISGIGGKSNDVPVLNVSLIGARHLPSMFGLKRIQGYVIKVKLFPGSTRFDSSIQTSSWPKYNENFKFPLGPEIKSSIKSYSKSGGYGDLPETCFPGHFVVFTVYVLLELPPGSFNRFKDAYRSLRERSETLLKKQEAEKDKKDKKEKKSKDEKAQPALTHSESRRNIGCVTYFLNPKLFKKSTRGSHFVTEEMWLPIKDITATGISTEKRKELLSSAGSPKGQIELILELCENDTDQEQPPPPTDSKKPEKKKLEKQPSTLSSIKKKITPKSSKNFKGYCLKVTTSKMRCSIKVKDEFETSGALIYVKTKVFEHDVLCSEWKSDNFVASLSSRWDTDNSTIVIPLMEGQKLDQFTIKTTVATKSKVGKKIVLGTVVIGPKSTGQALQHWQSAIAVPNKSVAMFHNFI